MVNNKLEEIRASYSLYSDEEKKLADAILRGETNATEQTKAMGKNSV